jgi:hypothetical protein
MAESPTKSKQPPPPQPEEQPERAAWLLLPAWAASLVFHIVLIVVLGFVLQASPKGLQAEGDEERRLAGEVVLKHRDQNDSTYYEDKSDAEARNAAASSQATISDPLEATPTADPTGALPAKEFLPGGRGENPGIGQIGSAETDNPRQPRAGLGGKGGTTSFFGAKGVGSNFMFVVDRSASMQGTGTLQPLEAAKSEMLAALSKLDDQQRFHIIFYNDQVVEFQPPRSRTNWADDINKSYAATFLRGVIAEGPTVHYDALLKAIRRSPDVIFFLTDAGFNDQRLSERQLEEVLRRNRDGSNATIHCVKFGSGPEDERQPWMLELCNKTGGTYRYVDMQELE